MDFSKILHGFVKIDKWISPSCNIDLSKLKHRFLKVVIRICQNSLKNFSMFLYGFVKVVLFISQPLPSKTKLKFDQDFKACETSVVYY